MVTVMTETRVQPGHEKEWDQAIRERVARAGKHSGWISVQLMVPEDDPSKRIVLGTWKDQGSWERWHTTEEFQNTRKKLDPITASKGEQLWFDTRLRKHSQTG